ncbi:hypothetical protein [Undibacterium sp.]|uniref:hypothetical protein n=1 Tax=Undibacterium sp. TaxID=1914977 RepID=UPI00374C940F
MKSWLVVFLALLILGTTPTDGPRRRELQQQWSYVSFDNPKVGFLLRRQPDQASVGDLGFDAIYCKDDEAFFCFEAAGVKFAVPKDFEAPKTSQTWSFHGHSFVATPMRFQPTILGQWLDVFYIDSVGQKMRFFYSKERGLIGIKKLGEKSPPILLVEEFCGFAAAKNCRES